MAHIRSSQRPMVVMVVLTIFVGACDGTTYELPSEPGREVQVASLALEPTTLSLIVGGKATLNVSAKDQFGQPITGLALTWSTSNSDIVAVDSTGSVVAISGGSAVITVASATRSGSASIDVAPAFAGDPLLGRDIWKKSCQSCHAGAEGWDIAHFGYSDADILRRGRPHGSDSTAVHVLAYIRTLAVSDTANRNTPIFQPGGQYAVLQSDLEFAISTFGIDAWPDTLTPAGLKRQNPRSVSISLRMPTWSTEESSYDWLPGDTSSGGLPLGVRAGSWKLEQYYANPTLAGAVAAAKHIIFVAHNSEDGPCRYPPHGPADLSQYDPMSCFNVGKWAASLVYVEGIRNGRIDEAGRMGAQIFWEVGHLAHKSVQHGVPIPNVNLQIAAWTYLGWQYNRAPLNATLYTAVPLSRLGLQRQSTWFSLRTLVERDLSNNAESRNICSDVREPAEWGYNPWIPDAMSFSYKYLISLLEEGWIPPDISWCEAEVKRAQGDILNRAREGAAGELKPLVDRIMALLASAS